MDAEFKKLLNGGIWALNATDNKDPDSTDISPQLVRTTGFPSAYSQQAGGVKPDRRRINQLLRELSGGAFEVRFGISLYDAEVDYPVNAITQVAGSLFHAVQANGPSSTVVGPTDVGQTAWESVTGSVTEPEPPQDILFDNSTANQLDIRWRNGRDGGSRIARYDFQYRLHNDSAPNVWLPSTPINVGYAQYTLGPLQSGSQLQVRMRAITAANDVSNWATSVPSNSPNSKDRVLGSPPGGGDVLGLLARQNGSAASALLTWTAPDDGGFPILRYIIQWRVASTQFGETNQVTNNGVSTTQIIPNLIFGLQYFFRVAAENRQGVGEWSNIAPVTLHDTANKVQPTLSAPTIVRKTSSSFEVSANWSNNPNQPTATPSSAQWQWRRSTSNTWTNATYTGLTGFSVENLIASTTYQVRYRLTTDLPFFPQTGYSPVRTLTTNPAGNAKPGAPSVSLRVTQATGVGRYLVTITWGAAKENGSAVDTYRVSTNQTADSGISVSVSRNTRSYFYVTNAPVGTSITAYVSATSQAGEGPAGTATATI